MDREAKIIRVSIMNVAGNALLALMKGVAGAATGSIAIILDAVNSLADALGSVIAIIGTKVASKPADEDHPFGHGRSEYLASIVIAALILAAGLSSLKEAVSSILHPQTPSYTTVALVIVGVAACVKFGLGLFTIRKGKELSAATLTGSGTDSLMDGCVSAATLVAALVYIWFGILIESWLAAVIAVLIVKNGFTLLSETASKLLGEHADPKLIAQVEHEICSVDGVKMSNGIVLSDLGPDRVRGSVSITVDGNMTVAEFERLARRVQRHVFETCGVMLAGLTPHAAATGDATREVRSTVGRIVWSQDHVVELRSLYVDPATRSVRLDAAVELGYNDYQAVRASIESACTEALPDWTFDVRALPDVAD